MQTWQANLAPRFTAGLSDYSFFQNWAVRGKSVKPKSSQIKRLIGTMHHNFRNCSSHRRRLLQPVTRKPIYEKEIFHIIMRPYDRILIKAIIRVMPGPF